MSADRASRSSGEREPAAINGKYESRLDEIINTAALLFDERGYAGTSMERIAEAVGLAKPTLYHYFDSKADILVAIHEMFMDPLIRQHVARLASGASPEAQLVGAMTDILALMESRRAHVRVFFEHHRELPRQSRRTFMQKRALYQDMITQCIRDGCKEGIFRTDNPELVALAIFGMCNWAYQWWHTDSDRSPTEVAQTFADVILMGIRT